MSKIFLILFKILPERVDMSRLTGKEWDDLLEEILQKQAAIKKREESQKIMEREIEESLQSVDDLRAKTEEETELYRSKSELHLKEVLQKKDEIDALTGLVENMKLKQEEQHENNRKLQDKLQTDIRVLKEKYDQTESQKSRCEDDLQKVNERLQNADDAKIEIQRLQEIIKSKENELNTINTTGKIEIDENNTRQKESLFTKLFSPAKKASSGENNVNLQAPTPSVRQRSVRSGRSILKPNALDEIIIRDEASTRANNAQIALPATLRSTENRLPNLANNLSENTPNAFSNSLSNPVINSSNENDRFTFGGNSSKTSIEIPVLDISSPEKIELFLDVFQSITDLFQPDDTRKLIINVLIRNNLSELIPFLTQTDLSSPQRFADFIRQSFSTDEYILRKQYQELSQRDLSEIQYFRLVFRQYYSQKGMRPPKSFTEITSEAERSDISFKFISTLTDSRLREKLFLADIPFEELPSKATRFAQILKRSEQTNSIFNVDSTINTCKLCGSESHNEKNCMASSKNKRRYKKRIDRSYSRSQERYPRSRERYDRRRSGSRTRYSSSDRHSPYRYYNYSRSNSRGREPSRSNYGRYGYRSRSNSGYRRQRSNSGYRRSNSGYQGRSTSRDDRYRYRDYSRERYRMRDRPDGKEYNRRDSSPRVRFNDVRN